MAVAPNKWEHRNEHREGSVMLNDYHYNDRMFWPNKHRVAVTLTFDFHGGQVFKADRKIAAS
jgi:hypothetical protein